VPGSQLKAATQELAERLAQGPAFALAKTKELLDREAHMSLEAALECEAQAQAVCMQHPDYREAYEAFVDKRAAKFE
jgi:enoyl-CoA hydratase/carnithine racemase